MTAALDAGVGRIVVDNPHELDVLERLAARREVRVPIWLRLSPNIDVHTHAYRKTGLLADSNSTDTVFQAFLTGTEPTRTSSAERNDSARRRELRLDAF